MTEGPAARAALGRHTKHPVPRWLQPCAVVEPRLGQEGKRSRADREEGTRAPENLVGGSWLMLAEHPGPAAATPILDVDPHRAPDRRDLIDGSPGDRKRRQSSRLIHARRLPAAYDERCVLTRSAVFSSAGGQCAHQDIIGEDGYDDMMRTTVTLEEDTMRLLKESMLRDEISFKEAINRAIRKGLRPASRRRGFRQRTYAMGFDPAIPYDKTLQLAGQLEDQELLRKLAAGK